MVYIRVYDGILFLCCCPQNFQFRSSLVQQKKWPAEIALLPTLSHDKFGWRKTDWQTDRSAPTKYCVRAVFVGPLDKLSIRTHQHTKRPSVAHNSVSRIQSDRKLYFLIACSKLKTIKNYSQLLSVCYVCHVLLFLSLCYLFSQLFFFSKKSGENK